MIRVVLAVLVAVALVVAARPAIQDARTADATAALDRTARELTRVGTALARTATPVPPGVAGAQRRVELTLPPPSATQAAVRGLRLRCRGPQSLAVTARVGGVRRHVSVDSPVRVALAAGQQTSGDGGATRLEHARAVTLRLWRLDGRPALVVAEGSNAVPEPLIPCSGSSNDSGRERPRRTVSVRSRSTGRPAQRSHG